MISVFDMFSVGIGPSSSHTVGPMRAALDFVSNLNDTNVLSNVTHINTELFGSLGQTGKGHGTGKAVILGLLGESPETVDIDSIDTRLATIQRDERLSVLGKHSIAFPNEGAIVFHRRKSLPQHSNGLTFIAHLNDNTAVSQTYFSIGGGFIVKAEDIATLDATITAVEQPYPFDTAAELLEHCQISGKSISAIMLENEMTIHDKATIEVQLAAIWSTMQACVEKGIHTEGILPGGLKVVRRAPVLHRRLLSEQSADPLSAMDWVNLFALAVNEENAAGGKVVTAPTNGAAGVIPAVLCYFDKFIRPVDTATACRYLLTAAAIGILYKKNASISGAEVGCQGEVGVACSMAAGALTEIMGGTPNAVENAAEIGMEHNLGLTCDPVGGLVQVPCIERNAMGAIKAINACRLAMRGTGQHKVSLDKVIKTMRQTGEDMKSKYKETARGGLAVNIIEC